MAAEKPVDIQGTMCANTNQMRRIAGTAQQLNLPYALDFRLNSLLDQGGIHLVSMDSLVRRSDGILIRAFCWLKLVDVNPEDAVASYLSIRLNDWVRLQRWDGPIRNAAGVVINPTYNEERIAPMRRARGVSTNIMLSDVMPDERTPDYSDPRSITFDPPAGFNK